VARFNQPIVAVKHVPRGCRWQERSLTHSYSLLISVHRRD
jgi:hypothetical protein